ncbi:MAG: YidC/Oxa1 family membrane protein insertase [Treponema sp.]|nr:YidC/Oxa1 family membrane protein insertase [Treponema sp.]
MASVLDFFYTLVVLPVEGIIEAVFYFIRVFFPSLGVAGAIAGVSLAVNFLALPIYNMADSQQLKERETKKRLSAWASRIRRAFSGDERFMMLSYYYRLNQYHPAYALRETASILVQLPFFIAAYHFLSNCADLKTASLWVIKNLGTPDALLAFAGRRLNVLPVVMTVINLVSGFIYAKDAPLREKLQAPMLALLFLFLLYDSPSGLVLYWTLNNLFSLAKNAVKRFCPRPWLAVEAFVCAASVAAVWYVERVIRIRARSFYLILLVPLAIPLARLAASRILSLTLFKGNAIGFRCLFLFACLSLTLLLGLALPSSMIATSPAEFAFLGKTDSPLSYVWSSLVFASGLCLLWPLAIYLMAGKKHRPFLALTVFAVAASALFNVWAFKHDYGNVFVTGEVEGWSKLHNYGLSFVFLPVIVVILAFALLVLLLSAARLEWAHRTVLSVCAALLVYGGIKISSIQSSYKSYRAAREGLSVDAQDASLPLKAEFHLSRNGRNVVKIFLDRSMGLYVPYILEQFPELRESYRGFTLYPNTVSFSNFTVEGAPALYGGYEYSPQEMNKRKDELLNEKSNEAQKVVPKLLSAAGWNVTVADPVYTSYGNIVSKDFLSDCPGVRQVFTVGRYSSRYLLEHNLMDVGLDRFVRRGIIKFFVLQALYPPVRYYYYAHGRSYTNTSVPSTFLDDYSTLYYLSDLTDTEATGNTYTMLYNLTAHDVTPLMEPDYHPVGGGQDLLAKENIHTPYPYQSASDLIHYECNATAFIQVGRWLDFLKESGVYDNTRVIIVGDHGFGVLSRFPGHSLPNSDCSWFHTVLMVKDFGADGDFHTDSSFMTNADSVWLSLEGLGLDMTNPYTGKMLTRGEDFKASGVNLFFCLNNNPGSYISSTQYPIDIQRAYHVSDDIFTESNWVPLSDWLESHPEDTPEGVVRGAAK